MKGDSAPAQALGSKLADQDASRSPLMNLPNQEAAISPQLKPDNFLQATLIGQESTCHSDRVEKQSDNRTNPKSENRREIMCKEENFDIRRRGLEHWSMNDPMVTPHWAHS
jgi:hypothetical protein